jgi:predicted dithiol-disulfide oxidoreductase (DUF899 family)
MTAKLKGTRKDGAAAPEVMDRPRFQVELDALRVREKAHTHEGDAIAAARRRLPMVEVDAATRLVGGRGPVELLEAFEGRRQLIAYYFMWQTGRPAPEQCEGCTWVTSQVRELSYVHSRDVTFAVFCKGPSFISIRMVWLSEQTTIRYRFGRMTPATSRVHAAGRPR